MQCPYLALLWTILDMQIYLTCPATLFCKCKIWSKHEWDSLINLLTNFSINSFHNYKVSYILIRNEIFHVLQNNIFFRF